MHCTSRRISSLGYVGEPCLICCNVPNAIGGATEFSASHGVLIDSTRLLAKMRFYFQKNEVFLSQTSPYPHPSTALLNCFKQFLTHPPVTHTHTHTREMREKYLEVYYYICINMLISLFWRTLKCYYFTDYAL